MQKPEPYLELLQRAIRHLHKCESKHVESIPVKETFRGETVWEGNVEVFLVTEHARAKRCYAWSRNPGQPNERFTVILEIPPVRSASDAVRASIIADAAQSSKE